MVVWGSRFLTLLEECLILLDCVDACGGFSGRALPIAVALGQSSEQVRQGRATKTTRMAWDTPKSENEDFSGKRIISYKGKIYIIFPTIKGPF